MDGEKLIAQISFSDKSKLGKVYISFEVANFHTSNNHSFFSNVMLYFLLYLIEDCIYEASDVLQLDFLHRCLLRKKLKHQTIQSGLSRRPWRIVETKCKSTI